MRDLLLLAAEDGGGGMSAFLTHPYMIATYKVLAIGNIVPILVSGLVWAERRVSAWIQDRLGPNRVGPFGLLQSFADLFKFLLKEDVTPGHVNKPLFVLAPALAVIPPLVVLAFIPFAEDLWIVNVDAGIFATFAFASVGVYALALGGWASNSKYSLLGGVRASAQMISYELILGLSAMTVFLTAGSLNFIEVVRDQADGLTWFGESAAVGTKLIDWNIFKQPVSAILFMLAGFAETNRLPFDMPEAETELAAGYHTEYSSMKFALFFLGEYAAMVAISALFVVLYLGGWTLFGLENVFEGLLGTVVQTGIFLAKLISLLFFFIWVRWTLPRFRYDQLMSLGWKRLLPISLGWLVIVTLVVALMRG